MRYTALSMTHRNDKQFIALERLLAEVALRIQRLGHHARLLIEEEDLEQVFRGRERVLVLVVRPSPRERAHGQREALQLFLALGLVAQRVALPVTAF